jgi:hypothetical protein
MDTPTYRCWTKATDRESGVPRRSQNWVVARRAWLRVFRDRLECGDWVIPIAGIRKATMYEGRSLFGSARVLELQTEAGSYQFGMNPWVLLDRHLPFDVDRVTVKFRLSPFSLVVRLFVLGYIVYLVWTAL